MSPGLLQVSQVTKEYSSVDGAGPVTVLRGVDLEMNAGETVAVVGPSGSGKSTLLNIIGTLDSPTQGRILFEGQDLTGLDEERLAAFRNRHMGFVFQAHHLLPQCTVLENVLVPTLPSNNAASRSGVAKRARQLLDQVGLASRLEHQPSQLSGGERQRVAVVRALINQPRLVLADEPTGALDRASAEALGDLLVELNREHGAALILVTHSLDLARRMSRVLELCDGRLRLWDHGTIGP